MEDIREQHKVNSQKKPQFLLLGFLMLLVSGPEFATDMYIPSLPAIAHQFHVAKSSVAMTITGFLLGQALFQFFHGSFSDHYGRKKTIILGAIITLIGSLISMGSHNLSTLMIGRVIQGAGAGAGLSMTLAIARDVYEGPKLAKAFSILFTGYFVVFAGAPIIGGYLQHYFNWRSNFLLLSIYFVIEILWTLLLFKETYTKQKSEHGRFLTSLRNYTRILKNKTFMGNMIAASLVYSSMFAYAAITPFLFQKELHFTAIEYGWLSVVVAGALIIANVLAAKLVTKMGLHKPSFVVMLLTFVGAGLMLLLGLLHLVNIWVIMIPYGIFIVGVGIAGIICLPNALSLFGDIAGSAGALWGALQFLILFASSLIYAHVRATTQVPFAWVLLIIAISCTLFLLWVMPKRDLSKD